MENVTSLFILANEKSPVMTCDPCLFRIPLPPHKHTTTDVKIKTEIDLGTLKSENIQDEKDPQKKHKEAVVGYRRKQANLRAIRTKERSQMREKRKRRRKASFRENKQLEPGYCDVCEKEYSSLKLFDLHKYLHKIKSRDFLKKNDFSTGQYICTFCEAKCTSMDKLDSHLLSHEEPCKECDTTFPNAFVLGVHLAEHDNEHRICCPYCPYKGSLAHCLKTHLLTRHFKLKIFRCEDCGANYSAKTHLEEHKRFHHQKMDPYVCIVCERTFIFKTSLQKHQINSHRPLIDGDVPSNFCIICKRTLSTVEALKKHTAEKHEAEKPPKSTERFICDICGKDFSHRQSWLLHTKGHSGLKPYACKLCSKTFRVRAFLTQHEKTHSDEKPFSCEMCGTCFKRKEGLRRHLQTHTDVKPFVCNNCDKSFRRREHLKLHLNSCNRNMAVLKLLQTQNQDSTSYVPLGNLCSFCYFCGKEFDLFALGSHECDTTENSVNKECEPTMKEEEKDEKNNADISIEEDAEAESNNLAETCSEVKREGNKTDDITNIEATNDTQIESNSDKGLQKTESTAFAASEPSSGESDVKPSNKMLSAIKLETEITPENPLENAFAPSGSGNNGKRKRVLSNTTNFDLTITDCSSSSTKDQSEAVETDLENLEIFSSNAEGVEDVSSSVENKPENLGITFSSSKKTTKNITNVAQPVYIDLTEEPTVMPMDKSIITVGIKRELIEMTRKMEKSNTYIDLTEEELPPSKSAEMNSNEESQNVNRSVNIGPDNKQTAPAAKGDIAINLADDDRRNAAGHIAGTATADNATLPLYCEFCGNVSSCSFELTFHKDFIHENHFFDCSVCGELFKKTSQLLFHYKLKHEASSVRRSDLDSFKYYCSQCGRGFNSIYMLLDHKTQLIDSRKHVIEKNVKAICDDSCNILPMEDDGSDSQEILIEPSESARNLELFSGFQASKTILCELCNVPLNDRAQLEEHQSSCPKDFKVKNVLYPHDEASSAAKSKFDAENSSQIRSTDETVVQVSEISKRFSKFVAEKTKPNSRNLDKEFKQRPKTEKYEKKSSSSNKSDDLLHKTSRKASTDGVKYKRKRYRNLSGKTEKNEKSEENQEKNKKRKRTSTTSDSSSKKSASTTSSSLGDESGPPRKKSKNKNTSEESEKLSKATRTIDDKKDTKPSCNVLEERKIKPLPETRSSTDKKNSNNDKNNKRDEDDRDKYRKKLSKETSLSRTKSREVVPLRERIGSGNNVEARKTPDQPKIEIQDVRGKNDVIRSETSFRKYLNKGTKSILINDQAEESVSYAQYKTMRSSKLSSDTNPNSDAKAALPNTVVIRPLETPSGLPRRLLQTPERRFSSEDTYAIQRGQVAHPRPLQHRRASLRSVQDDVAGAAEFSDEPDTDEETPQEWEIPKYCEVCGMQATNFETLRGHMEEVHHGFKFKCFVCDMGFDNIDTLIRHQSKYSKTVLSAAESRFLRQRKCLPNQLNPYNCGFCGLGFTLIDLFIRHKQDRHTKRRGIKNSKGNGKKFEKTDEETALKGDNLKRVDDNNTEIIIINSAETRMSNDKSEVSLEAGRSLETPSSETNKFIEFCEVCGQQFSSHEDKQRHFHLQNFECVICRRTFEDLSLLADHYDLCHQKHEIHNFEMTEVSVGKSFKYYCKFCGMGFYFIEQVLAHKEVQHCEPGNNSTGSNFKESGDNTTPRVNLAEIFAKPKVIPGLDIGNAVDQDTSSAVNNQSETNVVADDLIMDVSSTESPQKTDRFMDLHEYLEQNNLQVINGAIDESGRTDDVGISSSTVASETWIEAADQLTSILNEAAFMEDLNRGIEGTQSTTDDSSTVILENRRDSNQIFCEVCGKCFENNESVSIHRINNHDKNPFACSLCKSRFQKISSLITHRDTNHQHQGDSREKCSYDKETPNNFRYYCSRCGEGHYDVDDMKKHGNAMNCNKAGSSASGSDNKPTTSHSSREPVSSNSDFKRLTEHTSQRSSSKNSIKNDKDSDLECAVSTTTGDVDDLSTKIEKNKSIDNNTIKKADSFLRKCDCGEMYFTKRKKWREHIRQCKTSSSKKEKIPCPVCPNRTFTSQGGYQSHVKNSTKHQKRLQKSQSRASSASSLTTLCAPSSSSAAASVTGEKCNEDLNLPEHDSKTYREKKGKD